MEDFNMTDWRKKLNRQRVERYREKNERVEVYLPVGVKALVKDSAAARGYGSVSDYIYSLVSADYSARMAKYREASGGPVLSNSADLRAPTTV